MPTDDELSELLARTLDADAPPAPPADRIAALRARVEAGRPRPPDAPVAALRPGARRRHLVPWLVAAAAVALAIGFGVGRLLDDRGGGTAGDVEFAGSMTGPGGEPADAELTVTATGIGRVVELDTAVLPILPVGEFYEVWFVGADDSPQAPQRISAGTFHPDPAGRSDVQFAAAVNPANFPTVEITAEPGDGNPRPTGPVVLRAEIPAG